MDEHTFDHFARNVGKESRRTVLGASLAAALGLTLIAADDGVAGRKSPAQRRREKKRRQEKRRRLNTTVPPGATCETDGECKPSEVCTDDNVCETCADGLTGCEGDCLNLSVCPDNEQHVQCNNSPGCICTRRADNNNSRFCAVSTTCQIHCGANNSCPDGMACVVTCCDGPGNAGLRCLPSCG